MNRNDMYDKIFNCDKVVETKVLASYDTGANRAKFETIADVDRSFMTFRSTFTSGQTGNSHTRIDTNFEVGAKFFSLLCERLSKEEGAAVSTVWPNIGTF